MVWRCCDSKKPNMLEDSWLETDNNAYLSLLVHHYFAFYPPWLHLHETFSVPNLLDFLSSTTMPYLNKLDDGRLFETVVHKNVD